MTENELGMLLARIATFDNRKVEVTTLGAWRDVVGDLRYDLAVRAVNDHHATSTDYLMPRHIVALTDRYLDLEAREARLVNTPRGPQTHATVRAPGHCTSRDDIPLIHQFDDTSGWCIHGCGWRDDGQSIGGYNTAYPLDAPRVRRPDQTKTW